VSLNVQTNNTAQMQSLTFNEDPIEGSETYFFGRGLQRQVLDNFVGGGGGGGGGTLLSLRIIGFITVFGVLRQE
jgi:hypothetical protein